MAKVLFYFEPDFVDVFSGRDVILDAWNYAIKAAGDIDECVIVDNSGRAKQFDSDLPTSIVSTRPVLSGSVCCLVGPGEGGAASLWTSDHNFDWYAFGPASGWTDADQSWTKLTVPQSGSGALHAVHIASVVMLHRHHVKGIV